MLQSAISQHFIFVAHSKRNENSKIDFQETSGLHSSNCWDYVSTFLCNKNRWLNLLTTKWTVFE